MEAFGEDGIETGVPRRRNSVRKHLETGEDQLV